MRRIKQDWSEGRVVPRYALELSESEESSSGSSIGLTGTPAEVADRIGELARAGADGIVLGVGLDPEAALCKVERFANEVAPRLAEQGLRDPPP